MYPGYDREMEILKTWVGSLTNEALVADLRRLAEDPRGWSLSQRQALIEGAATRIEKLVQEFDDFLKPNKRSTDGFGY